MKIIFDSETTGLDIEEDEIIQLSIIDEKGHIIFNDYFQPIYKDEWPHAQKITGITPEMVKDKPFFQDKVKEIQEIFDQADELIGYNTPFDLAILRQSRIRIPDCKITDVMVEFAQIYTSENQIHSTRYYKLSDCANYYGYDFQPHDSLEDSLATLYCYQKIHQDDYFTYQKSSDGMWHF